MSPVPTRPPLSRVSIKDSRHIPNVAIFIKRTALEFLQILFNQQEAGSYRYDQDDTKTELLIADLHAVDLKAVGVMPAIIGVRGPLNWQDVGLGSVETRHIPTGSYTFSGLLNGSVALSCISREGIEAEHLAHMVFTSFKMFRPVLQKYGFFQIKGMSIGGEMLVEQEGADDKTTIVPVYVSAAVQDKWLLEETASRQIEQILVQNMVTANR